MSSRTRRRAFDIGLVAASGSTPVRRSWTRYMWGLRNIDKTGDGSEVKNRVFSISVGFRF